MIRVRQLMTSASMSRRAFWACLVAAASTLTGLAGCTPSEGGPTDFAVHDSSGIVIASNPDGHVPAACVVSPEPVVSIGAAAGEEPYQLYRVFGATRLSDGRIVLVNQGSQELRYYDRAGRHLLSAGHGGEGPGEFRNAFYLWALPGDTVWVGDYRPFRFLIFGPRGDWVRTVVPVPEYANSPGVMAVLDDGRSVLGERATSAARGAGFTLRHQPVVVHEADGRLVETVGVYPHGRWGRVGDDPRSPVLYPWFESFTWVDAAGSTLVVGHGSEPRVMVFSMAGPRRLERIVTWTGLDREVRPRHVAAGAEAVRDRYAELDPALAAGLVDPLVSPERPVAERFPAFRGLRLGRDGRIWIREYERPGSADEQAWTSFDGDGRRRCSLRLAVDELLELGADYLLAKAVDQLGVERVLEYALEVPEE
jgi:hypothetical protein